MNEAISIGAASRLSGVKVPTIRYYEQIGILPSPPRTDGNRRLYDAADLRRLAFIRHARDLGFDMDAIRALLDLRDKPAQPCAEADAIARTHLRQVENRIGKLEALRAELERMIEGCSHGRVEECKVIEVLTDHGQCESPVH